MTTPAGARRPDDTPSHRHDGKVVTMTDVRRLPLPAPPIRDWQTYAACRDTDGGVFFHPADERGPAARARDEAARRICGICPVVAACLRHALAVREPYGVWGGLTTEERDVLLRRRSGAA